MEYTCGDEDQDFTENADEAIEAHLRNCVEHEGELPPTVDLHVWFTEDKLPFASVLIDVARWREATGRLRHVKLPNASQHRPHA